MYPCDLCHSYLKAATPTVNTQHIIAAKVQDLGNHLINMNLQSLYYVFQTRSAYTWFVHISAPNTGQYCSTLPGFPADNVNLSSLISIPVHLGSVQTVCILS